MSTPILNSIDVATDFRDTPTGPIALIDGQWYSVNGARELIVDVRFRVDAPTMRCTQCEVLSINGVRMP